MVTDTEFMIYIALVALVALVCGMWVGWFYGHRQASELWQGVVTQINDDLQEIVDDHKVWLKDHPDLDPDSPEFKYPDKPEHVNDGPDGKAAAHAIVAIDPKAPGWIKELAE